MTAFLSSRRRRWITALGGLLAVAVLAAPLALATSAGIAWQANLLWAPTLVVALMGGGVVALLLGIGWRLTTARLRVRV